MHIVFFGSFLICCPYRAFGSVCVGFATYIRVGDVKLTNLDPLEHKKRSAFGLQEAPGVKIRERKSPKNLLEMESGTETL